jgi:hypothetical protein
VFCENTVIPPALKFYRAAGCARRSLEMMANQTGMNRLLALVFAALWCGGCGNAHGALCEEAASCGGGGDEEIDACIVDLDGKAEVASIYGCEDDWDDFLACMEDSAECQNDELRGCGVENDRYKDCVDRAERGEAKIKGDELDEG